ncbi:conjugal transfer protein MobC [Olivibacter domesticus]|uniref:Type IV secretory system Conjugative DNA transfer n=1 Tax=Olivibacter domesticus TaxID=407022 RepID=A0A1H7IGU8_OLID1|nr:conjugal transfer protein MobC [Olivibacter domesticus]SEK60987.1 Type IV secretory system Conjugative DNA transfer [Olivibacter domesticus]
MGMQGDNDQALRKILDMTRMIAVTILLIHFYYYCYNVFQQLGYTTPLTDRILANVAATGLLRNFHLSKCWALGFLLISLMGAQGKKGEKHNYRTALAYLLTGILIYFLTFPVLYLNQPVKLLAALYIILTSIGFLLVLSGGTLLTRIIKEKMDDTDIFNDENETFPQEERLLIDEYSFNLPARYKLKGKIRNSFINCLAVFRAVIVSGSQGSGKTAFCIRHIISQFLAKEEPYTMLVYDFKFPDLSKIAYNHWLKNKHRYKKESGCFFINFDDLSRSHRGNVFDPLGMTDITDATESSRTILLGLNPEWKRKQGDFFVESPINFFTAIIWYLRRYKNGKYCTLPHAIEFIQLDYNSLFTLLRSGVAKECEVLINPFITAYLADVMEQLEGQIASAKIALARLASPALYYVLSGNDFSLDINNPEAPKIICLGNNPQKILTYGAVLSLYVNRLLKIVNQKRKLKTALIFDEFPTLSIDIIPTISTGRSNLISVILGLQDESQLRRDYGKEQADVIMNTVGNIISGQVTGDSARQLSERIGKINQDRQSISINSGDTSISKNKQLEYAVPASKIASLSSGEFVGMVADTPHQKIALKAFHCEVINDWDAINAEEKAYKEIPIIRQVDQAMVDQNYQQVRQDVQDIVQSEIERMINDPQLASLIIRKR